MSPFFPPDMFPSAKRKGSEKAHTAAKKRKLSPGKAPRQGRDAKLPKRNGPGGPQHRDQKGKGWKKSRDGDKQFGRKSKLPFGGKKAGDGDRKFGGKKKFEKSFRSKGQKSGFKKKGAGAEQGFRKRKGKGKG